MSVVSMTRNLALAKQEESGFLGQLSFPCAWYSFNPEPWCMLSIGQSSVVQFVDHIRNGIIAVVFQTNNVILNKMASKCLLIC